MAPALCAQVSEEASVRCLGRRLATMSIGSGTNTNIDMSIDMSIDSGTNTNMIIDMSIDMSIDSGTKTNMSIDMIIDMSMDSGAKTNMSSSTETIIYEALPQTPRI